MQPLLHRFPYWNKFWEKNSAIIQTLGICNTERGEVVCMAKNSKLQDNMHRWENNIKCSFKNKMCGSGLYSDDSGYGPVTGFCEHGNESSDFMKGGTFLERLNYYL
jgi:hypothetical protein